MRSKKMVMAIGIAIVLGSFGLALASSLKIGSVDIQKAVNESNAGKEAKKAMLKEVEKSQRQFAEKQKELQIIKESLDKQALMLNPEVRASKEKDFQNKVREFQRWQEDTQNEINQKKMEMERNISLGLMKVIQKLGADEGYTFIMEEGSVPFVTKTIDITDRVIKVFDAQKK
ncbi:MAG: OmpH family outer membrane protein [Thermodesulfobacteriota bacterium]|nr:OmpH family outer membrane protein [Thermodesulfobacteriota bacterium]